MTDAVTVAVRLRPFNARETADSAVSVVQVGGPGTGRPAGQAVLAATPGVGPATFQYDHCFNSSLDAKDPSFASQVHVFTAIGQPVLDHAWAGYNTCVFAYGQTGSGKSYTMMGGSEQGSAGMIPRLCNTLFSRISAASTPETQRAAAAALTSTAFNVVVSYLEIYNERIRDLLAPGMQSGLKIREDAKSGPYVDGLTWIPVTTYSDIERLIQQGNQSRTVAATMMNQQSSRSHAIFGIRFVQTSVDSVTSNAMDRSSNISLVDLAGSERVKRSGVEGVHLKEAANINKSLLTLGMVISTLAKGVTGSTHVPYRDSVLTRLLQESLGGNARTFMIATVSPAESEIEETRSTLQYAQRVKMIVNKATINEDPNVTLIKQLRAEMEQLRAQLAAAQAQAQQAAPIPAAPAEPIIQTVEKVVYVEDPALKRDMAVLAMQNWMRARLLEKAQTSQASEAARQQTMQSMGISVPTVATPVGPAEETKSDQPFGFPTYTPPVDKPIAPPSDELDNPIEVGTKRLEASRPGQPYLVNLHADPQLNESLVYYIPEGVLVIGRAGDIKVAGVQVFDHHCALEYDGDLVVLTPSENAVVYVNGEDITTGLPPNTPCILDPGSRICIGWQVFRFHQPALLNGTWDNGVGGTTPADWATAQQELVQHELNFLTPGSTDPAPAMESPEPAPITTSTAEPEPVPTPRSVRPLSGRFALQAASLGVASSAPAVRPLSGRFALQALPQVVPEEVLHETPSPAAAGGPDADAPPPLPARPSSMRLAPQSAPPPLPPRPADVPLPSGPPPALPSRPVSMRNLERPASFRTLQPISESSVAPESPLPPARPAVTSKLTPSPSFEAGRPRSVGRDMQDLFAQLQAQLEQQRVAAEAARAEAAAAEARLAEQLQQQRDEYERRLVETQDQVIEESAAILEEERRKRMSLARHLQNAQLVAMDARNESEMQRTIAAAQAKLAERLAAATASSDRYRKSSRRLQTLQQQLAVSLPLIAEANAMAEALGKPVRLEVQLVPNYDTIWGDEIDIDVGASVKNLVSQSVCMWDHDTLLARMLQMRQYYETTLFNPTSTEEDLDNDPFYCAPVPIVVGTAHVALRGLLHGRSVTQTTPIHNFRGERVGLLHLTVSASEPAIVGTTPMVTVTPHSLAQVRFQNTHQASVRFLSFVQQATMYCAGRSIRVGKDDATIIQADHVQAGAAHTLHTSFDANFSNVATIPTLVDAGVYSFFDTGSAVFEVLATPHDDAQVFRQAAAAPALQGHTRRQAMVAVKTSKSSTNSQIIAPMVSSLNPQFVFFYGLDMQECADGAIDFQPVTVLEDKVLAAASGVSGSFGNAYFELHEHGVKRVILRLMQVDDNAFSLESCAAITASGVVSTEAPTRSSRTVTSPLAVLSMERDLDKRMLSIVAEWRPRASDRDLMGTCKGHMFSFRVSCTLFMSRVSGSISIERDILFKLPAPQRRATFVGQLIPPKASLTDAMREILMGIRIRVTISRDISLQPLQVLQQEAEAQQRLRSLQLAERERQVEQMDSLLKASPAAVASKASIDLDPTISSALANSWWFRDRIDWAAPEDPLAQVNFDDDLDAAEWSLNPLRGLKQSVPPAPSRPASGSISAPSEPPSLSRAISNQSDASEALTVETLPCTDAEFSGYFVRRKIMGSDKRWFMLRRPHLLEFPSAAAAAVSGALPRKVHRMADCVVKRLPEPRHFIIEYFGQPKEYQAATDAVAIDWFIAVEV